MKLDIQFTTPFAVGFAAFLATALLPATSTAGEQQIVGLDKNRQPASVAVSATTYTDSLKQVIASVNESTLQSLNALTVSNAIRKDSTRKDSKDSNAWMLRTVGVGLSVTLTAGLGPIFAVSGQKGITLIYSNSADPILP